MIQQAKYSKKSDWLLTKHLYPNFFWVHRNTKVVPIPENFKKIFGLCILLGEIM